MTDSTPKPDGPAPIDAEVVDPKAPPAAPVAPPADDDEHGVPSFDFVRDKIERRYTTSLGAAELAEDTAAAHTVERQETERAEKARAKLEEIRRSLGR